MWTANRAPTRPQRTGSIHSVASAVSRPTSMTSPQLLRQPSRSTGYESDQSSDTAAEDEYASFPQVPNTSVPPMWQGGRQNSGTAVSRLSQKFAGANVSVAEVAAPAPLRTQHSHRQDRAESSPDDDTHSRSSTLNGDDQDYEFPEKTPTSLPKPSKLPKPSSRPSSKKMDKVDDAPSASPPAPHLPGPLESQLAALMSKIIFMERKNPVASVTPEDYEDMSKRLKALEEEKKSWTKRHEAIWALRDEDVENNIKIRGMLAKARRELEGMTKLRDEDLVNVQIVRSKLAETTRQLERLQAQNGGSNGRASPIRGRPGSMFIERRDTTDLFAAAKAAALEQRALELEKRNSDLLSQIEMLKGGASIDDINRMTAHKAWKDTVNDLEAKVKAKDAEMARMRAGGAAPSGASASSSGAVDWHRVEALHEEHAGYRERMGGKLQQLRSEKEVLQRELHRKEDECHALEVKVLSLQRRVGVM
ncbi:hypothetical protein BU26DRAFT_169694 [Trematosphaeria pertusa]|uniref:Uncharacterized protein n=1 Tax=Trematosphaeria pertusa TaxID=390896 RepID=A0A6A6HU95_9PLEO|nr:uncharacterized protein BU26DRAFT_169694 [Trematosphaeria pertusa]KAF2241745.1 hypothetical protein BU26DRAFT_169694 [Trematosphaeria pertusa]